MKISFLSAMLFVPGSVQGASFLTSGHVDVIGIDWDGVSLDAHSHADTGAVIDGSEVVDLDGAEFAPGELVIVAPESTFWSRPSGSEWNPTGVAEGGDLWVLPQVAQAGVPFAGIGLEELDPADWASTFTIRLVDITSSSGGLFSMWQTDSFDVPTFLISSVDGLSGADVLTVGAGDHAHFNWGFSAPGNYELTFEISASPNGSSDPVTTQATYSFQVIPEPSVTLLGALGGLALLRRRR